MSAVRLDAALERLALERRCGLAPYITAGDGGLAATFAVLRALESAGASVIELGFPFSDPIADGPTLQAASQRALERGTKFDAVLELVRRFRLEGGALPIACMTYANPLLARGSFAQSARELADAGFDALIVPDVPLEESEVLERAARDADLAPIFFGAPTSSDERLAEAARRSRGFVYIVGRTGVTGRATEIDAATRDYLARARRAAQGRALGVGFGIARAEHVRALAPFAALAIVGSALVERVHRAASSAASNPERAAASAAADFLHELEGPRTA